LRFKSIEKQILSNGRIKLRDKRLITTLKQKTPPLLSSGRAFPNCGLVGFKVRRIINKFIFFRKIFSFRNERKHAAQRKKHARYGRKHARYRKKRARV